MNPATTAEGAVQRSLARIDAREAVVGAWQIIDRERALQRARQLDRLPARNALHGVPVGIKDIIDTVDLPTGLGFAPYAGRQPSWDASCVALCRHAGVVVMGKTVSTEFAYFSPGKTRNPHDLSATPGGSSSGSAAAVADGMVPIALGTQTAGSVIRPAAFCGVVGYKASHGGLSLSGIRPFAESHDSLGVLAQSVALAKQVREVLAMEPSAPALVGRPAPPRLGLCRTPQWERVEDAAKQRVLEVADRLATAGAPVAQVDLPAAYATLVEDHRTVMAYEAARNYAFEREQYAEALSGAFLGLCDEGRRLSPADYRAALQRIDDARRALPELFAGFDAWITPSALGEAPLASQGTGDPLMCRLWTALHAPAVALPTGRGPRGLPLGIQLVAPKGRDVGLLDAAAWCEAVPGFGWDRPPES